MPTYEYKCRSCGHHYEIHQSIKDEPLTRCPRCGNRIERLIEPGISIIFHEGPSSSGNDSSGNAVAKTCCGRSERCDRPPCTDDGECKR